MVNQIYAKEIALDAVGGVVASYGYGRFSGRKQMIILPNVVAFVVGDVVYIYALRDSVLAYLKDKLGLTYNMISNAPPTRLADDNTPMSVANIVDIKSFDMKTLAVDAGLKIITSAALSSFIGLGSGKGISSKAIMDVAVMGIGGTLVNRAANYVQSQ